MTDRKFRQSSFVLIVGAIALFVGKMDAATFLSLTTLVLGIYGAANVTDKKLGGAG
jgi:hypothetical protein